MIILALAATLLFDATPTTIAFKSPPRTAEAMRDVSVAPSLASVAVTLECTAKTDGRVVNCQVLGETHPGLGFGEAAIALMRDAQVEPGPQDIQFARTIQFTP